MPSDTDVRAALIEREDRIERLVAPFYIRWTRGPDYETAYLCVEDGEPDMCDFAAVSFGQAAMFKAGIATALQPSTAISEDRAREEVVSAVYVAMYGEGMDPHQHPEGWDYAEEITGAALKAAFARETTHPVDAGVKFVPAQVYADFHGEDASYRPECAAALAKLSTPTASEETVRLREIIASALDEYESHNGRRVNEAGCLHWTAAARQALTMEGEG